MIGRVIPASRICRIAVAPPGSHEPSKMTSVCFSFPRRRVTWELMSRLGPLTNEPQDVYHIYYAYMQKTAGALPQFSAGVAS